MQLEGRLTEIRSSSSAGVPKFFNIIAPLQSLASPKEDLHITSTSRIVLELNRLRIFRLPLSYLLLDLEPYRERIRGIGYGIDVQLVLAGGWFDVSGLSAALQRGRDV
jgi:hypothetical protein